MSKLHSINNEQRLYVLPCGKGFTCLGFDVAREQTRAYATWLKSPALLPVAPIGTLAAFAEHVAAEKAAGEHCARTGERCPIHLTPQLTGLEGWRVEVVRDGCKSRFIVGKSTGWAPCHLEIASRVSTGGGAAMGPFDSVRKIEKVY